MLNLDSSTLFASLIWGAIGSGFFIYGWKQKLTMHALCGAALCGASYFCGTALMMSLVSIGILVAWWFLKGLS